jgi:hypothetical protein
MRNLRRSRAQLLRWRIVGVALLALALLIPIYWIALRSPAIGTFHDDGVYLVTAKALATGRGYRIISLPEEIPQTKYPILFPLALSGVWKLAPDFPENTFLLKSVPLAFALLWYWLSFLLIKEETSREVAVVCVALTAALPWTIYLSTTLLSETMFAALCTGSLLLLRRVESRPDGKEWIAAALLAGLACLTRTAGVCIVATGAGYFLLQRQLRHAAAFLAIALAVVSPWLCWLVMQYSPRTDAFDSAANYTSWNVLSSFFSWGQKLVIIGLNALLLLASPLYIATVHWFVWLNVLAGASVLYVSLRWVRPLTVLRLFLAVYAAMLLAWAWPPDRFVVAVYPLVLCLCWQAWRAVLERFPQRAGPLRLAGLLMLAAVVAQSLWNLRDPARGVPLVGDAWSDTAPLFDWIKDHTPADAVILANLDPAVYLYTGRKAVRGFQADPYRLFYAPEPASDPLGTRADFRETIRKQRVTYLVRVPNKGFAEAPYLDRLILDLAQSDPDSVRLVAEGQDTRFQIYQVVQ